MYCPNCATANTDDTKFCRSCGSNLTLIPQALTGRLPEAPSRKLSRRERRRHDFEHGGPPNLANGITKMFIGFGFLLVAFASLIFADATHWWFWLLIPAFATLGKGVAEIVSARYSTPALTPGASQTAMPPTQSAGQVPPRGEGYYPPASVTEQTTRQLDRANDPYGYRDRDSQ